MILFLVVQGVTGIQKINTMQLAAESIYNQTYNQTNEINGLKMDMQKVPLKYLECMMKGTLPQLNLAHDLQMIRGKVRWSF